MKGKKIIMLDKKVCKLFVNDKPVAKQDYVNLFSSLLDNLQSDAAYKSCLKIAPKITPIPNDAVIKFIAPYGNYTTDASNLKAVVKKVIDTHKSNQAHAQAIAKMNLQLKSEVAFTLDGIKPENKKGKKPTPLGELPF
jgi:hypothetical protein